MGAHPFLLRASLRVCCSLPHTYAPWWSVCAHVHVCVRLVPEKAVQVQVQKRRLRVCRTRDGEPVLKTVVLCAHSLSCSGVVSRSESDMTTARRACPNALSDSGSQGLKVWFPLHALSRPLVITATEGPVPWTLAVRHWLFGWQCCSPGLWSWRGGRWGRAWEQPECPACLISPPRGTCACVEPVLTQQS